MNARTVIVRNVAVAVVALGLAFWAGILVQWQYGLRTWDQIHVIGEADNIEGCLALAKAQHIDPENVVAGYFAAYTLPLDGGPKVKIFHPAASTAAATAGRFDWVEPVLVCENDGGLAWRRK
jgi:hypothetical protein